MTGGIRLGRPLLEVDDLTVGLRRGGDRTVRIVEDVSFAVDRVASVGSRAPLGYGDQVLPRLPHGGLVRWMGARGELRRRGSVRCWR